jgi:hypothetical protein
MAAHRIGAGLAALGLAVGLAACGGGSNQGTTSAAAGGERAAQQSKAQDAALKFARCMREHGVDLPDPQGGRGGGFVIGGAGAKFDPDDPLFKRAQGACQKFLAAARPNLTPDQRREQQEQALKFTRCMRTHGVDIPDAVVGGGGTVRIGPGKEIDPTEPRFQRAQKACGSPFGTTTR